MAVRRNPVLVLTVLLAWGGPLAAADDYQREVWSPMHSAAGMAGASDAQCLACHKEILSDKPLERAPSGIEGASRLAWYQRVGTYVGAQDSFHRRHLATPFARQVMDLKCNTCHQGHDPREEASVPMQPAAGQAVQATVRKQVNPETTCLLCHGAFPAANMGLEGDWPTNRAALETADAPNGCLTCHPETFRTVRHKVNYLRPAEIEKAAAKSSDVCFGCHGGRAWYRISYPYPRHPWPGMPDETPDWAAGRPSESDARFLTPAAKPAKPK